MVENSASSSSQSFPEPLASSKGPTPRHTLKKKAKTIQQKKKKSQASVHVDKGRQRSGKAGAKVASTSPYQSKAKQQKVPEEEFALGKRPTFQEWLKLREEIHGSGINDSYTTLKAAR